MVNAITRSSGGVGFDHNASKTVQISSKTWVVTTIINLK